MIFSKIPLLKTLDAEERKEFFLRKQERFLPYLRLVLFLFFIEAALEAAYMFVLSDEYNALNVYNCVVGYHFALFLITFVPKAQRITHILACIVITSLTFFFGFIQSELDISFELYWVSFFIPLLFIPLIPSFVTSFVTLWLSSYIIYDYAKMSSESLDMGTVKFILVYYGIIILVMSYLTETYRLTSFLLEKKLERAKNEAMKANEAKSQFLATMSHEVRTPLNGILGLATLMKDTPLNYEQKDYIETIRYSGEALLTILNDILDFSKIEAGKFEIEYVAFNPERMVRSIVNLMQSRAEEKNLKLLSRIDEKIPTHIISDPTRIRQVLLNLVSNAIKFTDSGSVTINVTWRASDENPEVLFEVTDTGTGISPENQDKLFKEFSQTDSSISRKYGGTGLGLAICKKITELMNGKIGVTTTEGEGSTFWIKLPVQIEHRPAVAEENGQETNAATTPDLFRPAKVLVVEDNKINQKVIKGLLDRCQHSVTLLDNGQEAIDLFTKTPDAPFDIVLMDMQMPIVDGVETTRQIRKFNTGIPIVALTANAVEQDEQKCLDAGMNGFLSKPVNPETLYATIRKYHQNNTTIDSIKQSKKEASESYQKLRKLEDALGHDYVQQLVKDSIDEMDALVTDKIPKSDDHESLRRHLHDLKNYIGIFGFNDLMGQTKEIENASNEKNSDRMKELFIRLERDYKTNKNHLYELYLDTNEPTAQAV